LIKIDQADANAYARIGAMWVERGCRCGGCVFDQGARAAPNDIAARFNLTRVYLSLAGCGCAQEAITNLEKAPGKRRGSRCAGRYILHIGRDIGGQEELAKVSAKKIAPTTILQRLDCGKKSDLSAAEAALQRAIAADSNFAGAPLRSGSAVFGEKRQREAGLESEKAAKLRQGTLPQKRNQVCAI